jgi:hypothetical protein
LTDEIRQPSELTGGDTGVRKVALSKAAYRWMVVAGILLLMLSLVLLAYALLPGAAPLRTQATLAPTLFSMTSGIP